MNAIKHVLVIIHGVDLDQGGTPLQMAKYLATKYRCTISLISFYQLRIPRRPDEIIENEKEISIEKQAITKRLTSIQAELKERFRGEAMLYHGSVEAWSDEYNAKGLFDLVIASRDQDYSILQNMPIPILFVPRKEVSLPFQNILMATDLSLSFPRTIIHLFKMLAEKTGCQAHLINVINTELITDEEVMDALKKFAAIHNIPNTHYHIVRSKRISEGILNKAHELNADCMFLKTYKKSMLESVISGSIANTVANKASLPLLIEKVDG
jgi:nucleotide-binding universal stress UspA family protein